MPPIRQSNRVSKPRDYLDPSPSCWRQQPAFTIYTESPKDLHTQLSDLGSGSDQDLGSDLDDEDLSEGLDDSPDEDLSEHLSRQLHESLVAQLPKNPLYQPLFPPKNRAGRP